MREVIVPRSLTIGVVISRLRRTVIAVEERGRGGSVPRWTTVAGHGLWFYYHEEHRLPHVAVRGQHRATVRLGDGVVLAGFLPANVHRAVRRFLAEHREEALLAWYATQRRQRPDSLT